MPALIRASGVHTTVPALDTIGGINVTQRPAIPTPSSMPLMISLIAGKE